MSEGQISNAVAEIALALASERASRQQRRCADREDFERLRRAGFLELALPVEHGGAWRSVRETTRCLAQSIRRLAAGDSSLALVSAMHPAVTALWLATPQAAAPYENEWQRQRRTVCESICAGAWWSTVTSEPGSGGDVAATRAAARSSSHGYTLSGEKHFASGTGIAHYMLTAAVPAGEREPDWFFLALHDTPLDGSKGIELLAEWDGHGMAATQSHALRFQNYPVTRIAWPAQREALARRSCPLVECLFAAVAVGIVDAAVEEAERTLSRRRSALRAYEQIEWSRARIDAWLIAQAFEGMLRAAESGGDAVPDVALGKLALAELGEQCLSRICRVVGGATFSRLSPFGHWLEDVRALGFLRPSWPLAYDRVAREHPVERVKQRAAEDAGAFQDAKGLVQ